MIAAGKNDIRAWYEQGLADEYKYMMIVYDRMDYPDNSDTPYYYRSAEEAEQALQEFSGDEMCKVMEIYDLALDMEAQLAEKRAWHLPGQQAEEEESPADWYFSMARMMCDNDWPLYSEEEKNDEQLRLTDAAYYYGEAAKLGHGEAALRLGLMYAIGSGVEKNPVQARELFEKAAENGMEFTPEDMEQLQEILED